MEAAQGRQRHFADIDCDNWKPSKAMAELPLAAWGRLG
jgi:hypothetical protein